MAVRSVTLGKFSSASCVLESKMGVRPTKNHWMNYKLPFGMYIDLMTIRVYRMYRICRDTDRGAEKEEAKEEERERRPILLHNALSEFIVSRNSQSIITATMRMCAVCYVQAKLRILLLLFKGENHMYTVPTVEL